MTCEDCSHYRKNHDYRLFSPSCKWCGGRLLYLIGQLSRPKEEKRARQTRVLNDWMQFHSEKELRELATWAAVEPERKKR